MSAKTGLYTAIGVVAVLAVGEVGGAYYFGGQAETKLNEFVAAQNAQMKMYGYGENAMTVQSYEKGLFSSKAALRSELNMPGASEAIVIDMPVDIQHGPVLFGKGGMGMGVVRMVMDTDVVSIINKVLPAMPEASSISINGDMQVTSSYTLGFGGDYSLACSAPASKVEVAAPAESMAFAISPGDISCSGTMSQDFMAMKGNLSMTTAAVEIEEMGGEVGTMAGVTFGFDVNMNPDDFPTLTYDMSVDTLSIPAVKAVITGLKAQSSLPESDGPTVQLLSNASIESVKFEVPEDQTVELSPVEMEESYNDISKALIRTYFEMMQKISAAGGDEEALEAMFEGADFEQQMMMAANEALSHGPDYKLSKFRVVVPERGESNVTFGIGLPEGTAFDQNNPEAIVDNIEADLGVRVDRDMAVYIAEVGLKAQQPGADPAEMTQMAGGLVDQSVGSVPFLKVEDGVIMIDVSIRNQMVTINDMDPMPVEQLFSMFGMGGGNASPPPAQPEPTEPQE